MPSVAGAERTREGVVREKSERDFFGISFDE